MDFWGLQGRTLICAWRCVILLCWDVIWKMEEQRGKRKGARGFRAAITEAAFCIPGKSNISEHSKNPTKLLDTQHGAGWKHWVRKEGDGDGQGNVKAGLCPCSQQQSLI